MRAWVKGRTDPTWDPGRAAQVERAVTIMETPETGRASAKTWSKPAVEPAVFVYTQEPYPLTSTNASRCALVSPTMRMLARVRTAVVLMEAPVWAAPVAEMARVARVAMAAMVAMVARVAMVEKTAAITCLEKSAVPAVFDCIQARRPPTSMSASGCAQEPPRTPTLTLTTVSMAITMNRWAFQKSAMVLDAITQIAPVSMIFAPIQPIVASA